MYSISESYFVQLHGLNMPGLNNLWTSFNEQFPYSMELYLDQEDYNRMCDDAYELAGQGHPECILGYSNDAFSWSEYHPKNSHVYKNGAIVLATRIGFQSQRAAMQFKLKWFQ